MIIRRLGEDDAEVFRELRLRALRESPEAFGSSYEETVAQPLASMAQRLRADPATPHDFVLGAFAPALVGMVGFRRDPRRKTCHKGSIWGMYVARAMQGSGVGRALLERVIEEARKQPELEQITLYVVSSNLAARHLYASCGFTVYGVEPRALKLDGRYLDEDLMILHLWS